MTIHDRKIRVELSDRGGVVLHFDGFTIWNTIGGKWGVTYSDNSFLPPCESIIEAFWAAMKWPAEVTPDKFVIEKSA